MATNRRGKRGNKEGSVYQRADGRWAGAITIGGGRTRQNRKQVYGRTREEVAGKLQELQHRARTKTLPSEGRLTVSTWAMRWLSEKELTVSPQTYADYDATVRNHIVPQLGSIKLANLKVTDVQRWLKYLSDEGMAPSTLKSRIVRLRSMLERAVQLELIPRNPTAQIKTPRVKRRDVPVLTSEEIRGLIGAARDHRLEALFVLALTVGARQSELLGLRWSDVHWDQAEMSISRKLRTSKGGGFVLEEPKRESRRRVALTTFAIDALRRQRARQSEEALALGPAWSNPWGLIFTNDVGSPIHKDNLYKRQFKPWLLSTKLGHALTFHDLRHIAATFALGKGVPLPIVSAMLGHKDQATTLRIYSHTMPSQQREAADAFEVMLAG
jgi:integrase